MIGRVSLVRATAALLLRLLRGRGRACLRAPRCSFSRRRRARFVGGGLGRRRRRRRRRLAPRCGRSLSAYGLDGCACVAQCWLVLRLAWLGVGVG